VNRLARNAEGDGELRHRQSILRQEELPQELARMSRSPLERSIIGNAHLAAPVDSVIVTKLHIIRVSLGPPKADPPLIVYGDRPLPVSVTMKLVQSIPRRKAKIVETTGFVDEVEFLHRAPADVCPHA
jgi:hypothetical protein